MQLKELVDINFKHWESEVKRLSAASAAAAPAEPPPGGPPAHKSSEFSEFREGTTRGSKSATNAGRKKRLDEGSSKSAIEYTSTREVVTPRDAESKAGKPQVRAKSSGSMGLHLRSRTTRA